MTVVARFDDRATAEYARTLAIGLGAPVKLITRLGQYVLKVATADARAVYAELAAEELV